MEIGSCLPNIFSQVIYSGGYSDGEPPLPIPNREAKPVIADGTARPGGRVGSRRALKESSDEKSSGDSFSCLQVREEMPSRTFRFLRPWNDVFTYGDAARMGAQAALTTILYVYDTPDNNRTRTIVYC